MKQCRLCKQLNVREINGLAVSKWCVPCRKIKLAEKKIKHSKTKGAISKNFTKTKRLCDRLWREASILHYGDRCIVNKDCKGNLNIHHVVSRSNKAVRWYVPNAVPLCAGHHVYFLQSAHQNPLWFKDFMLDARGLLWEKDLKEKANVAWDKDIELVKTYLLKESNPLDS